MRTSLAFLLLLGCTDPEPVEAPVVVHPPAPVVPSPRADPEAHPVAAPVPVPVPEETPAPPPSRNLSCDHPFIPSRVGDWRRYHWSESDQERGAELRLEAMRIQPTDDHDIEIRWHAQVVAADDQSDLGSADIDVRCRPREGAEEPWFGVIEQTLGMHATRDGVRWRWPLTLVRGLQFEGDTTYDPADSAPHPDAPITQLVTVHRAYTVEDEESIETEAGRFQTWRVRFQERHEYGNRGENGLGTMWIARDAGLVRSRSQNSMGVVQTLELVGLGQP